MSLSLPHPRLTNTDLRAASVGQAYCCSHLTRRDGQAATQEVNSPHRCILFAFLVLFFISIFFLIFVFTSFISLLNESIMVLL